MASILQTAPPQNPLPPQKPLPPYKKQNRSHHKHHTQRNKRACYRGVYCSNCHEKSTTNRNCKSGHRLCHRCDHAEQKESHDQAAEQRKSHEILSAETYRVFLKGVWFDINEWQIKYDKTVIPFIELGVLLKQFKKITKPINKVRRKLDTNGNSPDTLKLAAMQHEHILDVIRDAEQKIDIWKQYKRTNIDEVMPMLSQYEDRLAFPTAVVVQTLWRGLELQRNLSIRRMVSMYDENLPVHVLNGRNYFFLFPADNFQEMHFNKFSATPISPGHYSLEAVKSQIVQFTGWCLPVVEAVKRSNSNERIYKMYKTKNRVEIRPKHELTAFEMNLLNRFNSGVLPVGIQHNIPIYETRNNPKTNPKCNIFHTNETALYQMWQLWCFVCWEPSCFKCMAFFKRYEIPTCKKCACKEREATVQRLAHSLPDEWNGKPHLIPYQWIGYAGDDSETLLFIDQFGCYKKKAGDCTEYELNQYWQITSFVGRGIKDQYHLRLSYSVSHAINGKKFTIKWFTVDGMPGFICCDQVMSPSDLKTMKRILLRNTRDICPKTSDLYRQSPQSFHFQGDKSAYHPSDTSKLIKVNMKLNKDGNGVGYDYYGSPVYDLLDVNDVCVNAMESECMMRIALLTMLICQANGFSLGLPDSIGFLYYLNRGLAGHIDWPQFSKLVFLYKIFESKVGGKIFGWSYKSNSKKYILEQMVCRVLKPGGCVIFFAALAAIFNHGVGVCDGEAGMLSQRWQTSMSIKDFALNFFKQ